MNGFGLVHSTVGWSPDELVWCAGVMVRSESGGGGDAAAHTLVLADLGGTVGWLFCFELGRRGASCVCVHFSLCGYGWARAAVHPFLSELFFFHYGAL